MKKLNMGKNKNILGLTVVLLLSLVVCFNLFRPGYFSMHDDLQVMRLYQMEKCFQDGQIPCRWVPDMGAGFGFPLFNFYSPLPYYLGMFLRLLGLSFIGIAKILFGLSLVLSGIFVYHLASEFFGRLSGVVAAAVYLLAPYRAVDIYVRGALAESWALVFFPLIFWSIYLFIKRQSDHWYLWAIFSLTGLFLSHNIMSLVFLPVVIAWALFWLVLEKKLRLSVKTAFIVIFAFGLSSFFVLPSFFEKSLVNVNWLISDYFDYRQHFVSLRQLFISRFWGYGPSCLGPNDGMSLQIGWVQWMGAVVAGLLAFLSFFKKKTKDKNISVLLLIFVVWGFFVFMTHAKSVFIWEFTPLLSFAQFPWRLLGLVIFFSSFLVAGLVSFLKLRWKIYFSFLIILILLVLNIGYFHPETYYPKMTDKEILSGESLKTQSMAAILDYLPKTVKSIPQELAPASPLVYRGNALITEYQKRSNFWRFTFESLDDRETKVLVPVFSFPSWTVLVDQKATSYQISDPEGLILLSIPAGKHTIVGWFENTPVRSAGNAITLITLSVLILYIVFRQQNEKNI